MRTRTLGFAVVSILVAACSSAKPPRHDDAGASSAPSEAPTASTSAAPPAATAEPPASADPSAFVGAWHSPQCGARTYPRVLELADGGQFSAEDRVSPCPPGARCVWSGIVTRKGTWAFDGRGLTFTVDAQGQGRGPATGELPTTLAISGSTLVETNGAASCPYTKK